MKTTIASMALAAFAGQAAAATCLEQANQKKLRSHAQEYFMQKCEEDAKKACESLAKIKELTGSSKRNFVKKCVADAVGTK
jgi:predicted house-cleaning noncanonical NTP pyrophosphatase (MazG superfamily)